MSMFSYHGICMSIDDDIIYNRIIVKLNTINELIRNETNMRKLQNNPFSLALYTPISFNHILIIEQSMSNWMMGIYSLDSNSFIAAPIDELQSITPNIINDISRNFQRYAGAILRNEIPTSFHSFSNEVYQKWNDCKEKLLQIEKINTIAQANFTNEIKTNYDLEKAVDKAEKTREYDELER